MERYSDDKTGVLGLAGSAQRDGRTSERSVVAGHALKEGRMRTAGALVLVGRLGVGLLAGCAAGSKGESESPTATNVPVTLEVENHGWNDVVIYLVRGTSDERLGMVGALNSTTFTFPFGHLGTTGGARLKADPVGSIRVFYSEDLHLQPGQSIKWTLENDLSRSFLGIY